MLIAIVKGILIMQTLICPHWAPCHAGQDDDRFMMELRPKMIKLFFSGDSVPRLDIALRAATEMVLLRHHGISENGDQRGLRDRQHALDMASAHAKAWWNVIPANTPRERIAVEGLNEPHVWPWGDESPENVSAYYAELIRLMAKGGVRVVAGNLAVGWPDNGEPTMPPASPPIWKPFIPMFEAIDKYKGFYGHHDYWFTNGARDPWIDNQQHKRGGWGWWAGRSLTCPFNVPIIITETGIDAGVIQAGDVYGWHGLPEPRESAYFNQLIDCEMQYVADGRVYAMTPFTEDFWDRKWATYNTRSDPLHSLWLAHARDMEAGRFSVPAKWSMPKWSSVPWVPGSVTPTPTPKPVAPNSWTTMVDKWDPLVTKWADQYKMNRKVIHTIIVLESAGDPNVVNAESGCVGLMQINPLAGRPTKDQLLDPSTNIEWGNKILAGYITQHGSLEAGLCAYGGVKSPKNLLTDKAQTYLLTFEKRWKEVWPGVALPITVPVPCLVDKRALITNRWYVEEAVRKLEAGKSLEAREILLAQVITSLYKLSGDVV